MNTTYQDDRLLRLRKLSLALCCTAVLAACGGGGGGGSSEATPVVTGNPPQNTDAAAPPTAAPPANAPPAAPPVATSAPPSSGSTLSAANSCNIANFKADMLRAINEARSTARSCGQTAKPAVGGVVWNDPLFTASASHSNDMATRNYFDHDSPEGVSPGQRVTAAGYKFSITGENIAAGQVGIASAMSAWLGSPGHCNSIMNSRFVDVAVACVASSQATYRTYWTMELAAPQ
jgi:uncharacterized protein YkwD